jgi:hypothetical protein
MNLVQLVAIQLEQKNIQEKTKPKNSQTLLRNWIIKIILVV